MGNTDTSIDLNEIVTILAKKNKIIINEKDPILAVATINDYVINHYFQKSNEALSLLTSELEEIHRSCSYEAKQNARTVINASLKSSTQIIRKNTQESINVISDHIRQHIEFEIKPIKSALKISNYMLVFSSALLVIAAIIIAMKL